MSSFLFEPQAWAEQEFGECQLGDRRRNQRLIKLAVQMLAQPDGSTPQQTELWADLKAAYRLFDTAAVSFQGILEPHCRQRRQSGQEGDVKLILNDTTELDFGARSQARGLGPVGNGGGKGFFVHSGLMLNAATQQIEGLAGQEIFYRRPKGTKPLPRNVRRKSARRESVVWGKLIDRIGRPPQGVQWLHVCDRGADDYEVMARAVRQGCGFVIRAAKLHRKAITREGRAVQVGAWLEGLTPQGTRQIPVRATAKEPARIAEVTLRFGQLDLPHPRVTTPWLREQQFSQPIRVSVVELRELSPPKGRTAIRWVLYTTEQTTSSPLANRILGYYEQRWTIEDYHKCWKTGCRVESRQYETAERLERVAGLLSLVAVRLLQMRTVAQQTPERPAEEIVPTAWVKMLRLIRKLPTDRVVTIATFFRHLAGLGGHLLRKGDGAPGWITLWRGYEKLQLLVRGFEALKRSG